METFIFLIKFFGASACVGLLVFCIYVIIDIYKIWINEDSNDYQFTDEELKEMEDDNDLGIFMN